MGGNAFKQFDVVRMPAQDALAIGSQVQQLINNKIAQMGLPLPEARGIESYRDKETFGDIDVVVPSELQSHLTSDDFAELLANLSADGRPLVYFQHNLKSNVVSYGMRLKTGAMFQVDLLFVPADNMDFTHRYYSWNDLGAMLGRVSDKMGLVLRYDGLWLKTGKLVNQPNRTVEHILVTNDFKEAIEFLGFDNATHKKGFDTKEDMFRYVASGKHFDPEIYKLENRSREFRARVNKRPMYMLFLDWIEQNHPKAVEQPDWEVSQWHAPLFTAFPAVKTSLDELRTRMQHEQDKANAFKEKYNGHLVSHVTGLTGEALGNVMTKLESLMTAPEVLKLVEEASVPELRAWIAAHTIESGHPEDSRIHFAARVAAAAHAYVDQRRKYTNEPYIVHPKSVATTIAQHTDDEITIMAGWLHDTVEDTDLTHEDLVELFGQEVADVVEGLTDTSKPEDGKRDVRKKIDRDHSAAAGPKSHTAKLADLIDNSKSIIEHDLNFARPYLVEKELLLNVLTKGNVELHMKATEVLILCQERLVQEDLKKMNACKC